LTKDKKSLFRTIIIIFVRFFKNKIKIKIKIKNTSPVSMLQILAVLSPLPEQTKSPSLEKSKE